MKSIYLGVAYALTSALWFCPQFASAQVFLGNSSANWSNGANWVGGAPPSGSTAVTFSGAPSFSTSVNNIGGTLNVTGINFLNGGVASFTNTTSNSTAFTLNGNKIVLSGTITTSAVPHALFVPGGGSLNDLVINDEINLNIDLNGNRTMSINQAGIANSTLTRHHLTINGNIGQVGPTPARLFKSGDAILRLHGNNTFSGGLQMVNGTTQFTKAQSLSTGPLIFVNGTLEYTGTGNTTVSNPIGFVTTAGQSATLIASGIGNANSTVKFDGTFSHAGLASKRFVLTGNNTGSNVLSTVLTDHPMANVSLGALSILKTGLGRWTVDGNNTFTGESRILQGVLAVPRIELDPNAPQPLGRNGTLQLNDTGGLAYVGESPLVVASNRTLVLNSTIFNPTSTVGGGVLRNDALSGNTVNWSSTIVNAPSTLEANISRTFLVGGNNPDVGNKIHSQLADGADFVTANATFKRTLSISKISTASTWELTGNNTYSGFTSVQSGTLRVSTLENKGVPSNIGTGDSIGSNNSSINLGVNTIGTLEYIGNGSTTNRLLRFGNGGTLSDGSGSRITNVGTGPLLFTGEGGFLNAPTNGNSTFPRPLILDGNYAGTSTIEAIIQNNLLAGNPTAPVRLQKDGTTTWSLQGNNSYTGITQVNDGTLLINGNQSTATGNVTVAAMGRLGGNGMIGGATSIAGTLAPGNSPGVLSFAGDLSLAANSTLEIEIHANTDLGRGVSFDGVDVFGSLLIHPTSTMNLVFDSAGSTVDFSDPFWQTSRSYLIFDNANPYTGSLFSSIGVSTDSLGKPSPFGVVRTQLIDGDLYLILAIPEPTTGLLALLGFAIVSRRRPSRRGADSC